MSFYKKLQSPGDTHTHTHRNLGRKRRTKHRGTIPNNPQQPVRQTRGGLQSGFPIRFSGIQANHCSQKMATTSGQYSGLGVKTLGSWFSTGGTRPSLKRTGEVVLSSVFAFQCSPQLNTTDSVTSHSTVYSYSFVGQWPPGPAEMQGHSHFLSGLLCNETVALCLGAVSSWGGLLAPS